MATPMTADQTVHQLKMWGLTVKETDGWRTHNRAGHGSWGPVHGFIVHHTGDDAADNLDLAIVRNGRSDLPGPLAQFGIDDTGTVYLIGCGRANHAGGGDPAVLRQVESEDYGKYPRPSRFHEGSPGATDGNTVFYGVETFYSGTHKPTDHTYTAMVRLTAAVCAFHGWGAKSVIGHKEWSDWKVDPGNVDMARFRGDVAQALGTGPAVTVPADKPAATVHRTPVLNAIRDNARTLRDTKGTSPRRQKAGAAILAIVRKITKGKTV
jgi:N-acetylmuramoyl-L-alanine amidase